MATGVGEDGPFGSEEIVEMSQTISKSSGLPYGVQRICQVWEQAPSTFYERTQRALRGPERTPLGEYSSALELEVVP